MSAELIINCKVACRWVRMRDNVLFLLSCTLWATMIFALYHMKFRVFSALVYISVVATIASIFLLWSHFRRAVFKHSKKEPDRRSGHPRLGVAPVAGYFGMEEAYLRAMQQEKHTSIQHLQDEDGMAVSSYPQPKAQTLTSKELHARLSVAA